MPGRNLEPGLREIFKTINTPRLPEISSLLLKYIEEIELFNPAYGLVKVRNREELIIKHILDSLAPLEILQTLVGNAGIGDGALQNTRQGSPAAKAEIADVGSGAGLPGIPLAISLGNLNFTLIERMGRRAGFLRNCAAVLGLPNLTVEEMEMEKAEAGRFNIIVFRAFRPLEKSILKGLKRLLAPGGVMAAYKGRLAPAQVEMEDAEKAVPEIAGHWEIRPLTVPFLDEERHLVLIRVCP
jgi:16S rRNA (guanine527-N7)-methyltransferase